MKTEVHEIECPICKNTTVHVYLFHDGPITGWVFDEHVSDCYCFESTHLDTDYSELLMDKISAPTTIAEPDI